MNDNELILGLLLSYTRIVVDETKQENRTSNWYKMAVNIDKIISKRKVPKITPDRSKKLLASYRKVQELDIEYFKDIDCSFFAICILLIDYLIRERNDVYTRAKLGHFNTPAIITELETTNNFRDIARTHHRYITKLIEEIK